MNIPDLCCGDLDADFLAEVTQPGHWKLTLGSRGMQEEIEFLGEEFSPPQRAYKISEREFEVSDSFDDETSYIHFFVLAA